MKNSVIKNIGLAITDHWGRNGILGKMVYRLLLVMVLFSLGRVAFYLYNQSLFPQMNLSKFMTIIYGGLKFDVSAVLYTNLLFILFFLIPSPLRLKKRTQGVIKYIFFITNGVVLALNSYDTVFYPFTLRRTTANIFKEFENEGNLLNIFLKGIVDYWMIFLMFVIMVVVLVKLYGKDREQKLKSNWLAHYSLGLIFMLLGIGLTVAGLRGGFKHSTRPITLSNAAKYTEFPREISIVLNTPFAIFRTLGTESFDEKNYFADRTELNQIFTPFHAAPDSVGEFKPDNVVIIILESFGKEFFGSLNPDLDNGTYEGFTPFLDSLLTKSKTFNFTYANGRKSIDAMPSILASIPSIKTPYILTSYSGNDIQGLPALLKKKGYFSGFFHGAPNGSMGFQSFARLAGFDKYYGKDEYNNDDDYDGIWGIWDDKFFGFFADQMNALPQPFMTTLFSVSSHHPFEVPDAYKDKVKEGTNPLQKCINYSDMALREFFAKASQMPWYNHTLFVITADHSPPFQAYDKYRTDAGLFMIPIFLYHPQHPEWAEQDRNELMQQIDIMPSVLGYLNFDDAYFGFGRNVFDTLSVPYAINYESNAYQYFSGEYMLQYEDVQDKAVGLYNLKNDVLLENNLIAQDTVVLKETETKLKAFIQQYNYSIVHDKMTAENWE
ncbi:MAG TPA: sulfatase-like hydrolase/transferase [Draconibacterium sp.]|nr:sulfatase-like hydrolase/transferase [Draconibacterium sp.]